MFQASTSKKRILNYEGNLLYEKNTFNGKPYGLGTLYFANGERYQEAVFDVKGFIEGREYYPNGQARFEGKYMICSGYGPNYPMYGRAYDENGQQVFSGKFTVEHTGVSYPRIKNSKGYMIFQENHPKYKWLMWNEKSLISEKIRNTINVINVIITLQLVLQSLQKQ